MSDTEDILLALATAHNVVAIESNIPAAASFEYASPGLPFWAGGSGHDGSNLSREQWFRERGHILLGVCLDHNRFDSCWARHGERLLFNKLEKVDGSSCVVSRLLLLPFCVREVILPSLPS